MTIHRYICPLTRISYVRYTVVLPRLCPRIIALMHGVGHVDGLQ